MKRLLIEGNWDSVTSTTAKSIMASMPDKFFMVSVAGPLEPKGKCEWNFIRLRKDGMKARVVVNATLREMGDTELRTGVIEVANRDLDSYFLDLPHIEEFIKERLGSPILMLDD